VSRREAEEEGPEDEGRGVEERRTRLKLRPEPKRDGARERNDNGAARAATREQGADTRSDTTDRGRQNSHLRSAR